LILILISFISTKIRPSEHISILMTQFAMPLSMGEIAVHAARAKAIKDKEDSSEPATDEQERLVEIVLSTKSSITILQGPNGIGKITQIPAMILDVLFTSHETKNFHVSLDEILTCWTRQCPFQN